MSFLVNTLDSFFIWLSSAIKQNISDYCQLETSHDDRTIVARDGSLLSIVRLNGIKNLISGQTFFNTVVDPLSITLTPHFDRNGHMIQSWFMLDPDRTKEEISRTLIPAFKTAERLNLNVNQILQERIDNLSRWTSVEENYLVLWTRPSLLVKSELKEATKKSIEARSKELAPVRNMQTQDPYAGIPMLTDRHHAFVESIVQGLEKCGIACEVLSVTEASRQARNSMDPDFTNKSWEPFLVGDEIKPNVRRNYPGAEEWDIIWPKLSWQICPRDYEIIDRNFVQVGNRVFAPIYIDVMPKKTTNFAELFGLLLGKRDLPWRISYLIEGDGLASMATKKLFAAILGWTSANNKNIAESIRYLENLKNNNNETIVKLKIALCTWTDRDKIKDLSRRLSDLARGVEAWGSCLVSEVTGDPVAGVVSSALAITSNSIATRVAAPLKEVTYMLPLARPSSPWAEGAVTFRSPDGKMMPYQPFSSLQTTWNTLIFAKPGSGKSVLMNMKNFALILSPGITRLPRIGIIDIGPSSSGLISLVKESLPEDKKHYAEYYRLRMTEEFCINPFDTQLGCRFPLAEEKAFLQNFVALLVTDPAKESPPDGMIGMVGAIIDEMYLQKSDKYSPEKYTARIQPRIDEILEKNGFNIDKNTTWWEVVDYLFSKGFYKDAAIAQRYATPILSMATGIAHDQKITEIYGKKAPEGELLTDSFTRMLTDSLNIYKILARPTSFDLGEARIVSLDLDEVAKTGGPMADRQTAVMYMLARYVLGRDFKLNKDVASQMPYPSHIDCPKAIPVSLYREYHTKRAEEIYEDFKCLCMDEFHRTSKAQTVRDQVVVDMREGRKWKLSVVLASQSLDDFDKNMREFATTIFIMDGGTEETIDKITQVFGMEDEAERYALKNRITGPRRGGGTFMAKFSTKKGWYTQMLTSTIGSIELWAFSTTAEDVTLRNKLYKLIGPADARRILAEQFPDGSAFHEIERRKNAMRNIGNYNNDTDENIYDGLIKELMSRYH